MCDCAVHKQTENSMSRTNMMLKHEWIVLLVVDYMLKNPKHYHFHISFGNFKIGDWITTAGQFFHNMAEIVSITKDKVASKFLDSNPCKSNQILYSLNSFVSLPIQSVFVTTTNFSASVRYMYKAKRYSHRNTDSKFSTDLKKAESLISRDSIWSVKNRKTIKKAKSSTET